MSFWFREVMGWLLVVLGLAIFALCFWLLSERLYVETAPVTVIGVFVFRGGVHLLKVSVAARICARADERLYPAAQAGEGPRPSPLRRTAPKRSSHG